eukprot:1157917-Pelagomonas_calceolata.AAC.7
MNQVTDKGGKVPWGFLNAWATANYLAQGPMWQAPLRLLSLFTSALVQPCNPFQTVRGSRQRKERRRNCGVRYTHSLQPLTALDALKQSFCSYSAVAAGSHRHSHDAPVHAPAYGSNRECQFHKTWYGRRNIARCWAVSPRKAAAPAHSGGYADPRAAKWLEVDIKVCCSRDQLKHSWFETTHTIACPHAQAVCSARSQMAGGRREALVIVLYGRDPCLSKGSCAESIAKNHSKRKALCVIELGGMTAISFAQACLVQHKQQGRLFAFEC